MKRDTCLCGAEEEEEAVLRMAVEQSVVLRRTVHFQRPNIVILEHRGVQWFIVNFNIGVCFHQFWTDVTRGGSICCSRHVLLDSSSLHLTGRADEMPYKKLEWIRRPLYQSKVRTPTATTQGTCGH